MPVAAPLAAAIAPLGTAHPYTFTLAGADMVKGPSGRGVGFESVQIVERGPNGIDSLTFTIDDPLKAITLLGGEEIQIWDNTLGDPLFGGWLDSFEEIASFGQQGRAWKCRALGYSVALDRILVPSETRADFLTSAVPGQNYRMHDWVQQLIGLYTPWRNGGGGYVPVASTQANPIGSDEYKTSYAGPWKGYTVTKRTLRSAIETVIDAAAPQDRVIRCNTDYFVDFYKGFRFYAAATIAPTDIPTMGAALFSVSDSGPNYAESLEYAVDASSIVNRVYVSGPTVSIWVQNDASVAQYGRREMAATSLSDVMVDLLAAGNAELRSNPTIRGSYQTKKNGLHVGFTQTITNAAIGLSALSIVIGEVRTQWIGGGTRLHTVTFGGTVGVSAMQSIRTLVA